MGGINPSKRGSSIKTNFFMFLSKAFVKLVGEDASLYRPVFAFIN